eukprot:7526666-Pyramimonas_sp.AAC.1
MEWMVIGVPAAAMLRRKMAASFGSITSNRGCKTLEMLDIGLHSQRSISAISIARLLPLPTHVYME